MADPTHVPDDEALDLLVSGAYTLAEPEASACPEANDLAAFADGRGDVSRRTEIEAHASRCPSCCAILAALLDTEAARAAPPATLPAPPGPWPRPFGPYTLLRRIGGGGMGDVFEAEHRDRGRREAVKVLRAGLEEDPRSLERFLREIRVAGAVVHDHVVPLHDSGTVDGIPYFTMPLLAGPSLAGILAEARTAGAASPGRAIGPILDRLGVPPSPGRGGGDASTDARRVAGLLAGVARGLAEIHRAGGVHRDVKPSNIVLDARRRAVLTDFGLARLGASATTRAGEALGSPVYMAPEQVVPGMDVDGRADVYGLGATLYEMLTLRRPSEGDTLAATLARALEGRVPQARDADPSLPSDVDAILGRCLARDPRDRYADATALADDLERFARGEEVSARPLSAGRRVVRFAGRHRLPIGIAAAVLAVVSTLAYLAPGSLTIRSAPIARLSLDGEDLGWTPHVGRRLSAGTHEVVLRHEKFAPFARRVEVGRLADLQMDVVLRALDPADPEALALLAAALDVPHPPVEAALDRSPEPDELAVVLPRGRLRDPPAEVLLWSGRPRSDVRVRLAPAESPGGAPILERTLAPAAGPVRFAVPEEVRARLVPGAYGIVATSGEGRVAEARFEILAPEAAERIGARLEALTRRFEPDDLAARFLRADLLVADGLLVEALGEAARLRRDAGERREVGRIVLSALEGAGLRGVGPWFEWAEFTLRAGR